jgi:hypothetical protein
MKYENFDKVKSLVEQIRKEESFLEDLSSGNISITINKGNYGIQSIGAWPDCEHRYRDAGIAMVDTIKTDLRNRITKMKSELETL